MGSEVELTGFSFIILMITIQTTSIYIWFVDRVQNCVKKMFKSKIWGIRQKYITIKEDKNAALFIYFMIYTTTIPEVDENEEKKK